MPLGLPGTQRNEMRWLAREPHQEANTCIIFTNSIFVLRQLTLQPLRVTASSRPNRL